MDHLRMESPDLIQGNIDKIAALFPNCITESIGKDGKHKKAINFDLLRQILGDSVANEDEVYDFSWVGKKNSIIEAHKISRATLRPCPQESINWDSTENIYIEGDNLEALKLLQESYLAKIKMIYIDPPYNTGNDFIYKDNFSQAVEEYNNQLGLFDNETGNKLFQNTESNGRFHSDWCSMMYPRLLLARNLLRGDGAIFISIDDNEIDSLKQLCSSVFGERNFVATIPWRKRTAKSDVPFGVSQDYEWIVIYANSPLFFASTSGKERKYYTSSDFPGRPWRIHDLTTQKTASERPNSYFTIINPKTGTEYPANPNNTWRITKESFNKYYAEDRIIFPGDYDFLNIKKPVLRYWKDDDMAKAGDLFGRIAVSTKLPDEIGMSQDGTKELSTLLGGKVFPFPKPSALIKFLTNLHTTGRDIILDFFSGSATTAHAVMQLNAEDGGNRHFIMVQYPETCDTNSEAFKAGYVNICEIGKERIRRSGENIYSKFANQQSAISNQQSAISKAWILDSEYSNWQTAI
jgi:adenine-specific DNA-methyltransferase